MVDRVDPVYSLGRDCTVRNAGAERDEREDRQLVRGVVPADIERGIRLGVAFRLRVAEGNVERHARLRHPGQDVVARPVHDPRELLDAIARACVAKDANDRNSAAYRAFEREVDATPEGALDQRRPMKREEHLVRGDHAAAAVEGALDVGLRRVDAPHDLDEEIDGGVVEEIVGVRRQDGSIELGDAVLVARLHEHARDLERGPHASRERGRVRVEQPDDAAADRAAPQETNSNRTSRVAHGRIR